MRARYYFEGEEHKALRTQAHRFGAAQIAPNATAWEEAEEFPRTLYPALAEAGLMVAIARLSVNLLQAFKSRGTSWRTWRQKLQPLVHSPAK